MAKAAVVASEVGAGIAAHAQSAKPALGPTGQITVVAQRQPRAAAELPGRGAMVGAGTWQWAQAFFRFFPWLPVTGAIRQAIQATAGIKPRLLHRLLNAVARHTTSVGKATAGEAFGNHQAGRCPWLIRATPLDPGQAPGIRAQRRCRVEIGTLGQQVTCAIQQIDCHQSVLIAMLLDRQHLPVGELQIAITARPGRQPFGRFVLQ
ncbi:hypothetical protein D3C86_1303400 [compost metagenome]